MGCAALGLGKPTEMSLRDLLVEELKRRGVVVVPEVSFRAVHNTIKIISGFGDIRNN